MINLDELKEYLLSLNASSDDKRYSMNFCKKINYLEDLKKVVINETYKTVNSGYGNVNSNICIIIKNKKIFDSIKDHFQKIINKFGINIWDIYITFIDKLDIDYVRKFEYLTCEVRAVNPKVIYYIDDDINNYNELLNKLSVINLQGTNIYFLDTKKIISEKINDRKDLWNVIKYMINFKEI